MNKIFTAFAFLFLCGPAASAQDIISVETQNLELAAILNIILPIDVDYSVQNYKVRYTTVDALGRPDTASGLVSVPQNPDLIFPIAVYNHGTVANREAVPSRQTTGERILSSAIAASGYITCSPDYIGLGDSDGQHPYVHADSEASAGRDLVVAAKKWLTTQDIPFTEQLFVTGYSQGGHSAAAFHRDVELNPGDDGLDVTAAAYLSGPYSISDVMVGTIFGGGESTLPGYIAYTYISYNSVYGLFDDLGEAFVPPYLAPIDSFASELYDLGEFNLRLDALLRANNAEFNAIFQDSIRDILRSGDPTHPINMALRDNDTYDWAPEDPTLIVYCTQDEQVPFRNAILADSVMRANGSTSVTLLNGGPLTHGGCVIPAVAGALRFWEPIAEIVSSLGEPVARPDIGLSPNPVRAGHVLRLTGTGLGDAPFLVHDASGRRVMGGRTNADGSLLLSRQLTAGLHLLRIGLADGTSVVRKIVVR